MKAICSALVSVCVLNILGHAIYPAGNLGIKPKFTTSGRDGHISWSRNEAIIMRPWLFGRLKGGTNDYGLEAPSDDAADADFDEPDSEAEAYDAPDVEAFSNQHDSSQNDDDSYETIITREMVKLESNGTTNMTSDECRASAAALRAVAKENQHKLLGNPVLTKEFAEAENIILPPGANETISYESLTLDGSILKHAMRVPASNESSSPERGQEVFFHFRGYYGDVLFEDSRTRNGSDSRPVRVRLEKVKKEGPGGNVWPYMDAWELMLRSMKRGETSLFVVKSEKRINEIFQREISSAPDWVPRDGSQLRFLIDLTNFGYRELTSGGEVMYKCVSDGYGNDMPRAHDEVCVSVIGKCEGVTIMSTRGKRWVQLGVGLLPAAIEMALSGEFRKKATGIVIAKCQHLLPARPECTPLSVVGLRQQMDGHTGVCYTDYCGEFGSLGQVAPILGANEWGRLQRIAESNCSVEFEVELFDWNDVHNMRYAYHGVCIR
jgi:hypothetical protein